MGKQMTVGKRIAMGFTVVILIAVALGGLGVWSMLAVKGESEKLAEEYVPEVKVATDLRGSANRVMYAMRGYGLSEEEFGEWVKAVSIHGVEALKATSVQRYRQP